MNLLRANCELLQQGIDLLTRHTDQSFIAADPNSYGSGIGAHFRHVLDHYRSFLKGVEGGLIDYDARVRGIEEESKRSVALDSLESARSQMASIQAEVESPIRVKVCAATEGEDLHSLSSVGRELQFLVSHTVHHYALIAIASRMLGVPPDASFGVAPSTLKYLSTIAG